MANIDPAVAGLVLDAVSDDDFEIFSQGLLNHTLGTEFEPTGGMHDGGQDGFVRAIRGKPSHFVQISTRPDVKAKIVHTIKRLGESGREVELITYMSSRFCPNRDIIEAEIQKEFGVEVRIRDRRWITTQCQRDETVSAMFIDRFAPQVHSMMELQGQTTQSYASSERMSILTYLEVHSDSEPQEHDLLILAVDSAIYMSLEGTDPQKGIFKTEEDIVDFVESKFPAVKSRSSINIGRRIARLCSKTGSPRIRNHGAIGYCLPFEVRSEFGERSVQIRDIEVAFWESVKERARIHGINDDGDLLVVTEIVSHAINKTFEKQGLNFIASTKGAIRFEEIKTHDFVLEKCVEKFSDITKQRYFSEVCLDIIRGVFYSGSEDEKEYTFRLFKAFSVEFVIRGDDKVGTYFNQLARNLSLLVGSDILVRALSEICLRPEHQATQNTLRMLSRAGAELFLPEMVFEEVYGNIHAAHLEFQNFYKPWESRVSLDLAQQSDRILIRAYFYSKLEPERHARSCSSWEEFLSLFGQASWFESARADSNFAAYLQRKFGMAIIPASDIRKAVSSARATPLKERVEKYKKDERLAWNDAYLALYVDEMRHNNNEFMGDSVYGFRTWWLTEEFKVLIAAKEVGVRNSLNMHPQFLMNLYAASPGLSSLTKSFEGIFPVNFGLRITDRVDQETMHRFLESAVQIIKTDDAAAAARIRYQANRLLGSEYTSPGGIE